MDHAEKKQILLEQATKELFEQGQEVTTENLYYFLCGMQDSWVSDDHESDEKTLWLVAMRGAIHDRLNEMEAA